MIKKMLTMVAMVFGLITICGNIYANEVTGIYEMELVVSTKTYNGTMNVKRGSTDSSIGHFTNVTDNGNGTINLNIPAFKVGKMPGTITVFAENVLTDGTESTCSRAVTLKIMGFLTFKYDAIITVTAYDVTQLKYTLKAVDSKWNNVSFVAEVEFTSPGM